MQFVNRISCCAVNNNVGHSFFICVPDRFDFNRTVATSGSQQATAAQAVDNVRRYPHDAPERDMANFPPLKQPVNPGKLRIGVIPDEWFQFMYNKTGVTGKASRF